MRRCVVGYVKGKERACGGEMAAVVTSICIGWQPWE